MTPLSSADAQPLTPATAAGDQASAIRAILACLNSLSLGEISRVRVELSRASSSLAALGQPELAARVTEAAAALASGNVKEYRRAISNVTARLGHVK